MRLNFILSLKRVNLYNYSVAQRTENAMENFRMKLFDLCIQ